MSIGPPWVIRGLSMTGHHIEGCQTVYGKILREEICGQVFYATMPAIEGVLGLCVGPLNSRAIRACLCSNSPYKGPVVNKPFKIRLPWLVIKDLVFCGLFKQGPGF